MPFLSAAFGVTCSADCCTFPCNVAWCSFSLAALCLTTASRCHSVLQPPRFTLYECAPCTVFATLRTPVNGQVFRLGFDSNHQACVGVSQGVEFDQINVNIPDEYKQMYDAAAAIWLQVKEAIDTCKESGLIDPHQKKVHACMGHRKPQKAIVTCPSQT